MVAAKGVLSGQPSCTSNVELGLGVQALVSPAEPGRKESWASVHAGSLGTCAWVGLVECSGLRLVSRSSKQTSLSEKEKHLRQRPSAKGPARKCLNLNTTTRPDQARRPQNHTASHPTTSQWRPAWLELLSVSWTGPNDCCPSAYCLLN